MHKDAGDAGEVKGAKGEFLLRFDGGSTVNNLIILIQNVDGISCMKLRIFILQVTNILPLKWYNVLDIICNDVCIPNCT